MGNRARTFRLAGWILLSLSLAAGAATANADGQGKVVPLDVTVVATGGYWRSESDSGNFRVVVRSRGREHLSTLVLIEQLGSKGILGSVVVDELSDSAMFIVSNVVAVDSKGELSEFDFFLRDPCFGALHRGRI